MTALKSAEERLVAILAYVKQLETRCAAADKACAEAHDELQALRMKLITAGAECECAGFKMLGAQLKRWGGIDKEAR